MEAPHFYLKVSQVDQGSQVLRTCCYPYPSFRPVVFVRNEIYDIKLDVSESGEILKH